MTQLAAPSTAALPLVRRSRRALAAAALAAGLLAATAIAAPPAAEVGAAVA